MKNQKVIEMELRLVVQSSLFKVYQVGNSDVFIVAEGPIEIRSRDTLIPYIVKEVMLQSQLSPEEISSLLEGKSPRGQFNIVAELIDDCGIIILDPSLKNAVVSVITERFNR